MTTARRLAASIAAVYHGQGVFYATHLGGRSDPQEMSPHEGGAAAMAVGPDGRVHVLLSLWDGEQSLGSWYLVKDD